MANPIDTAESMARGHMWELFLTFLPEHIAETFRATDGGSAEQGHTTAILRSAMEEAAMRVALAAIQQNRTTEPDTDPGNKGLDSRKG